MRIEQTVYLLLLFIREVVIKIRKMFYFGRMADAEQQVSSNFFFFRCGSKRKIFQEFNLSVEPQYLQSHTLPIEFDVKIQSK